MNAYAKVETRKDTLERTEMTIRTRHGVTDSTLTRWLVDEGMRRYEAEDIVAEARGNLAGWHSGRAR